jgi:dTDP-4-dehydrorhamnose reductase
MRILVTGSNGLLGQKLSDLLQGIPGIELIATARQSSAVKLTKAEFEILDICDGTAVDDAIRKIRPDVVINTAAITLVDKCELERELCRTANVTAVENLIRTCEKYNVHFIHLSTDFIFDGSHGPLNEAETPNPVNYYGLCKWEAEKQVVSSKLSWCIIRTVLVYGITSDMSRSNIVLWVKNSLEAQKTIEVVNDQFRTPTLAEDLAMGCYLAASRKATGVYHISGKDFLSPYEIAIKTAEFFNLDKTLIKPVDSTTFTQPAKRPLITGFIIDKARKDLSYEPRSFDEGIQILASQIRPTISS